MDLVLATGQYNLVSWALNSFGAQLDEGLESFLDNLDSLSGSSCSKVFWLPTLILLQKRQYRVK